MTDIDFDFDCPFVVSEDGTVDDSPTNLYSPNVYNDPEDDIYIDDSAWEALTGWTNQHGYNGAALHSSEQFRGALATYVLATPGTYVMTPVYPYDDGPCCIAYVTSGGTDCIPNCEGPSDGPDSWVILRLKD